MTTFKANRKFPNPITVTDDPKSHTIALQQIIEALSIGQRRTKEVQSSYVRVHELVDVGLIEVVGNQLKLTNAGAAAVAAGATALADLTDVNLTGLADGDTLVWDAGTSKWIPGAAASGPITGADMYDVSLNDLADVGFSGPADGDVLTFNESTGLWESAALGTGGLSGGAVTLLETDYLPGQTSFGQSAGGAHQCHYYAVNGGTISFSAVTDPGHLGVVRLRSGATNNNGVALYGHTWSTQDTAWSSLTFDGDDLVLDYIMRVSTVSNTQCYWHVGLVDDIDVYTNELRVLLDTGVVKLRSVKAGAGTTNVNFTTEPTANAWHHIQIRCKSTSIRAYMDGVLQAEVTTNIPTVGLFPVFQMGNNGALADQTLDIDYFRVSKEYSTDRAPTLTPAKPAVAITAADIGASGAMMLYENDFLPGEFGWTTTAAAYPNANAHAYAGLGGFLNHSTVIVGNRPGVISFGPGVSNNGGVLALGLTNDIFVTPGNQSQSNLVLDGDDLVLDYLLRASLVTGSTAYWNVGLVDDVDTYANHLRLYLRPGSSAMVLESSKAGVTSQVALSPTLTASTWHHVQIRANTSSIRVYVDGNLAATQSNTAYIPLLGMFPIFQAGNNGGTPGLQVDVDYFRMSKVFSTNRAPTLTR